VINRPTDEDADFTNGTEHSYIEAGYIYEVVVNATLSGGIDCTVDCYTKDWDYNELTYTF
jgi:hypothetical protein